jgi:2-polyprenyl-3-methyl-5-hydroxy-6-metoxy-1,4-benzoquinol methylase
MKICSVCNHPGLGDDWRCPRCGFQAPRIEGFLALAPELAQASAGGFDVREFQALASVEQTSFWFRGRNRLIQWAVRRYCREARSFCEIGCGTGFVLQGLARACPELALFGSEVSVAGLAYAATRVPGATLFQMDATHMPLAEEFDVIGAFDVLEHIEDDRQVIRQVFRALRPGGHMIVTVPQHMLLWSAGDVAAHHVRRYARRELIEKLSEAGFRIALRTSFVFFLLPALAASRLASRNRTACTQSAELSLPRPVDSTFESTLAVERALISAGVRFPFGGSQLVVATKAA